MLDNPPFSILSEICEFYLEKGIYFFLFAPSLTCLSGRKTAMRMNHIICDCEIVYENGAKVRTSFVTNLGDDIIIQAEPTLTRIVNDIVLKIKNKGKKELPKYCYPDHIATTAMFQRYAKYGISIKISAKDCVHISRLDMQAETGKAIFGTGLLLSDSAAAERAAAERAAAERAAAKVWKLSDREIELKNKLNVGGI